MRASAPDYLRYISPVVGTAATTRIALLILVTVTGSAIGLSPVMLSAQEPAKTAEGAAAATPAGSSSAEPHFMVFLDAEKPIFIRMLVEVDGQGIGALRRKFSEAVFDKGDADKDGSLSADERTSVLPSLRVLAPAVTPESVMNELDIAPSDGKATKEEFVTFVDKMMGPRFRVAPAPRSSAEAVDLIGLLDRNRDGRLQGAELAIGPATLKKQDSNDDETFSIAELEPFRDPNMLLAIGARPTSVPDVSLAMLADPGTADQTIAELLRRYGREPVSTSNSGDSKPADAKPADSTPANSTPADSSSDAKPTAAVAEEGSNSNLVVPRDAFALSDADFAKFDADGSRALSANELKKLVLEPPSQIDLFVQLRFRLSGRKYQTRLSLQRHDLDQAAMKAAADQSNADQPKLDAQPGASGTTADGKPADGAAIVANGSAVPARTTSQRRQRPQAAAPAVRKIDVPIGGVNFELRVSLNQSTDAFDNRQFYRQQFRQVDTDKNKYLSAAEFMGMQLGGIAFETVDLDGDKMLVEQELLSYVEQETAAAQCKVVLLVGNDSQSLFRLLDSNSDNRLSIREFRNGESVLKASLKSKEQAGWHATDLIGRYQMTFELGRPRLQDAGMTNIMTQGMQNRVDPRIRNSTEGPVWFQKMDRNRDGDISRREFLGSVSLFDTIDADHDELISPDEAKAFDAARSAPKS